MADRKNARRTRRTGEASERTAQRDKNGLCTRTNEPAQAWEWNQKTDQVKKVNKDGLGLPHVRARAQHKSVGGSAIENCSPE